MAKNWKYQQPPVTLRRCPICGDVITLDTRGGFSCVSGPHDPGGPTARELAALARVDNRPSVR